jgi:hypothetical protein
MTIGTLREELHVLLHVELTGLVAIVDTGHVGCNAVWTSR